MKALPLLFFSFLHATLTLCFCCLALFFYSSGVGSHAKSIPHLIKERACVLPSLCGTLDFTPLKIGWYLVNFIVDGDILFV